MKFKSKEINFKNKIVFLRVDFNVPLAGGKIAEDFKLKAALPLIKFLLKHGAKLIVATHLGEPEILPSGHLDKLGACGRVKNRAKFSVEPLANWLAKQLKKKVNLATELNSKKTAATINNLAAGDLVMLENLRFWPGETKNSVVFARQLADLADVYINEAFAVCHRAHASVSAITKFLPSFAGWQLQAEIEHLDKAANPQKPLAMVIGGAKLNTKIKLVKKFLPKADHILIGGALANNFFKAKKINIGRSLADDESVALAKKLTSKKIILPADVVVLADLDGARPQVKNIGVDPRPNRNGQAGIRRDDKILPRDMILDIGPETMRHFNEIIKHSATVIWNGPMGRFEDKRFAQGTLFIARAIALKPHAHHYYSLVGGGETVQALNRAQVETEIDWVSTGGGASLAYLSGESLPGLKRLCSWRIH